MTNFSNLRSFVLFLSASLGLFVLSAGISEAYSPKTENNRKLCPGVLYSGPATDAHVPSGIGTLVLQSSSKAQIPDILIVGTFDGNVIRNAGMYQGNVLRYWGDMYYQIISKKMSVLLDKGNIYGEDGSVRFVLKEDNPITLGYGASSLGPADLQGQGKVVTYIDPVQASRYTILPGGGEPVPQTYSITIRNGEWKVDASDSRFSVGEDYSFDTKDYSAELGRTDFFPATVSDYEIDPKFDIFQRLTQTKPDTGIIDALNFMKESVPKTKAGFSYNYSAMNGMVSGTNQKDRLESSGGDLSFKCSGAVFSGSGLRSFFGTPNQDYSDPFVTCISSPEYVITFKISKNKLTIVSEGTIQLDCDFVQSTGAAKAPKVDPFSIEDLHLGDREGAPKGTLSEGTTHSVELPFLGTQTTWQVSSSTKLWATPRSTAGRTNSGRWSSGDRFPPYRAVRTVTQTVDFSELMNKTGRSLKTLMVELVATGCWGILPRWENQYEGRFTTTSSPTVNPGEWPMICLGAALYQLGGFGDPNKDFEEIFQKLVLPGTNQIAKDTWRAKYLGKEATMNYITGVIESASSLKELDSIMRVLYPNALPDDKEVFENYEKYFLSGLIFFPMRKVDPTDKTVQDYASRVQKKIVALLNNERLGEYMDKLLPAIESYPTISGRLSLIDHPSKMVGRIFSMASSSKAAKEYYSDPSLKKIKELSETYDSGSMVQLRESFSKGAKAAIDILKRDIERDFVCSDKQKAERDIYTLSRIFDALEAQGSQFKSLIDRSYVTEAQRNVQVLNATLAPAPNDTKEKEAIARFFGLEMQEMPSEGTAEPMNQSTPVPSDNVRPSSEPTSSTSTTSSNSLPRHELTSYDCSFMGNHVDINLYASSSYIKRGTGFGALLLRRSWKEARCTVGGEQIKIVPKDGLTEIKSYEGPQKHHWIFPIYDTKVCNALASASKQSPVIIELIDSNDNSYELKFQ